MKQAEALAFVEAELERIELEPHVPHPADKRGRRGGK
jgi:hypothetical protein